MTKLSRNPYRPAKRGPPPPMPPPEPVDPHLLTKQRVRDVRRSIAQMEDYYETMTRLTKRINTINDRLDDPALLETIPEIHPKRLQAEDLVDDLMADYGDARDQAIHLISVVDSQGRYLSDAELQSIGDALDAGATAFATVDTVMPELYRFGPWQIIRSAAVPF